MNQDWLSPVRAALDSGDSPLPAFCRDDDVGWNSAALWPLLDTLRQRGARLDMAAIPRACDASLAGELVRRMDSDPGLHLHQHGYAHINHQPEGRKCEFGDARPAELKAADLRHGRERLQELFGHHLERVFTPPWNRCDQATVDALNDQGYAVLSRDLGASPVQPGQLTEIGVSVDWCRKRDGVPIGLPALADQIGAQIRAGQPLGLMFHHAVMDEFDLGAVDELLALLDASARVRWTNLLEMARTPGNQHTFN